MQVLLTTKEVLEVLDMYKDKFGTDSDKKYEYAKAMVSMASNSRTAKYPYRRPLP